MAEVFRVMFKGGRKDFFRNPKNILLRVGDYVVVEAERGEDLGWIVQVMSSNLLPPPHPPRRNIVRKATTEDLNRLQENREKEGQAFEVCKQKIREHGLPMKLVDVEYQFDGNKISFYFTAESRVDFRALVKELASIYKTRIELRQIGVRDEAKRLGGYGSCGRPLCCATFMREFEPITTQMVRDQNLSLSLSKLSGVCGRLMCCLSFEREIYREELKRFPKLGTRVVTSKGVGKVSKADIFRDLVHICYDSGEEEKLTLEEVNELLQSRKLPFKPQHPGSSS